jgi:hypothetical protein
MMKYPAWLMLMLCAPALFGSQFSMVVLGDRTGDAREDVFEQILKEVKVLKPDLLMNVGDLIEGYTDNKDSLKAEWDTITRLLGTTGVSYHLTPGNHDITDSLSELYFLTRFGLPFYSFNYGDCHFTVIDNTRWDSAGAMPDRELWWLQQDLQSARNARLGFVFMHRSYWNAARRKGTTERLHELFKANGVDYVFSGHDHYYCRTVWDGITYTQLGPSGSRYKVYEQEERGAFQSYLLVNIADATVRITVMKPGSVLAPDCVSLEDEIQLDSIDRRGVTIVPVRLPANQAVDDSVLTTVTNVGGDVLSSRCIWTAAGTNWQVMPETVAVAATAHVSRTALYHIQLAAGANPFPLPAMRLAYPYDTGKQYQIERMLPIQRSTLCPKIMPPRLDGNLNDPCWKRLKPIRSFGTSDGKLAPTEPFEVYLGHDDTMLYLAARCTESQIAAMKTDATGRDGRVANDDNLNFLLCPNPDSGVYYQLIVNPFGTIWDRKCWTENGKNVRDNKWDAPWQIATGRGSDYWTIEIAVPLNDLGSPLTPRPSPLTWGLNIARFQSRSNAVGVFQVPFVHDVKKMADLQFVETLPVESQRRTSTGNWFQNAADRIRGLFRK